MAERTKLSFNFPRFFTGAVGIGGDGHLREFARDLGRELEKLHREIARILNLSIGDADWIAPSLTNSWANVGGAFADAGYMKMGQQLVILSGAISGGTVGSAAFTLPAGYRPANTLEFVVDHNAAFGELTINSSGEVIPETNPNTVYYLEGVIFRADG